MNVPSAQDHLVEFEVLGKLYRLLYNRQRRTATRQRFRSTGVAEVVDAQTELQQFLRVANAQLYIESLSYDPEGIYALLLSLKYSGSNPVLEITS